MTPFAVAAAGAATFVAALTAAPFADAAPPADPDEVKAEVERLYEQAETATEKYNGAKERESRSQRRVGRLQDQVARGQAEINRMRSSLGYLAAAQYRGGVIAPELQLILSSDPDDYLERAAVLSRVGARQAADLRTMRRTQRVLDQRRAEAADELHTLARTRAELARHKHTVQRKLASARRLLHSLNAHERTRLRLAPEAESAAAPEVTPRPIAASTPPSSRRAATAATAVLRALGAPYSWASAGPRAFDCSGLTYWAYQQAGVTIPRTSQAQMHAGRRVSLSQARPGDLVIYRSDASHVGMYMGGGQVIHAPYPGARVRYDPVDMMPVAAITRV